MNYRFSPRAEMAIVIDHRIMLQPKYLGCKTAFCMENWLVTELPNEERVRSCPSLNQSITDGTQQKRLGF